MALKSLLHYPFYFALDEQINFARCFPAVGWKWPIGRPSRTKPRIAIDFPAVGWKDFAPMNPQLVGRSHPQSTGTYAP
jgi:hypothetical protein